jgi:hypothetical protein
MIPNFLCNAELTETQRRHYTDLFTQQEEIPAQAGEIDNLWIVTAASEKFWMSTKTLAESIRNIKCVRGLLVFDLGLSPDSKQQLKNSTDQLIEISDALLGLVDPDYLAHYQFKIDGIFFAPYVISKNHKIDSVLWLDSGVLVQSDLSRFKQILNSRDLFLCDISTRLKNVRALNHIPLWETGNFPFSDEVLCKPLLWAGIHGYRVGSKYHAKVINLALEISLLVPNLVKGNKFVTTATQNSVEATILFKNALDYARRHNIELASSRWNGARHDLFLYTCLYHTFTDCVISSKGLIEDVTDGQQTKRTAAAVDPIKPERLFSVNLLKDPNTEFVIHRGTLGV